jgi:hypothetical protein
VSECVIASGSSRTSREGRLRRRSLESRRHQRVKISLQGRYMLEDRREFDCLTRDMSPGGIALAAPVVPAVGERVVVYLDSVGRIDGNCVRDLGQGFAMSLKATPRRREKIAEQLTWIANQQLLGLEDLRSADRIVPRRLQTMLSFGNGTNMPARIVDLSFRRGARHRLHAGHRLGGLGRSDEGACRAHSRSRDCRAVRAPCSARDVRRGDRAVRRVQQKRDPILRPNAR